MNGTALSKQLNRAIQCLSLFFRDFFIHFNYKEHPNHKNDGNQNGINKNKIHYFFSLK
jgi:hypothetical protein